jgi:hypothetical protein
MVCGVGKIAWRDHSAWALSAVTRVFDALWAPDSIPDRSRGHVLPMRSAMPCAVAAVACPARSAARPKRLRLRTNVEPRCAADAGPPQSRPWRSRISGAPLARATDMRKFPFRLGARARAAPHPGHARHFSPSSEMVELC